MDCRITSSTKRRAASAFTLLETMVGMIIGSFVFLGMIMLGIYTTRSFAALGNYMELDKQSRNTLDRMTQIIRESDGVLSWSNNELVLSYHTKPLSFSYASDQKKLFMTDTNGTKRTLLGGCDFLDFQIFQRTSMAGVYDQYPITSDDAVAKIVQISWVCSRSLVGELINSESVQSAKIVIRKQ